MKHHILPLLLLLPLTATAQGIHLKFGGGLSSHYGSDQMIGAFKIGIGYEVELTQHWSFTPGIEVYGKGAKNPNQTAYVFDPNHNQLYNPDTGQPLTGIINRSATQNYLEVPLLISYYLRTAPSSYIIVSAGPYLAYGLSGKQKTKGDTQQSGSQRYYYEQKTFNEPGTHRFDCGVQTYLGYQFPSSVSVGLEADWGIAKFNTAGRRNVSALIALGYKF